MITAAGIGVAMPGAPERVRTVDRVAPAPGHGGLLALFGRSCRATSADPR